MSGKRARIIGVLSRTNKTQRSNASLRIELLEPRHLLTFTPGNPVVERVGDGGLPIATAKPLALFEFTTAANQTLPVSTVGLPASNAGASNQGWVTDSSKSQTNGHLHLSTDGHYLTLIGYDALLDSSAVNSTDASAVNRNVARIDAAGNVAIAARLSDAYDSTNGSARSAVSTDGNALWLGGSSSLGLTGGLRHANAATGTPTTSVQIASGNIRDVNIYGGILFAATTQTLSSYGTPSNTAATATPLPGLGLLTDIGGFVLFDRSPTAGATGLNGLDTLYLNDGTGIGQGNLRKFEWDAATSQWVARGAVTNTGGLFGLAATLTGSNVQLYATSGLNTDTGNNKLLSLTDTSSFGGNLNGAFTMLAQAGPNFIFRGVAFAPTAANEDTLRVTNFQWNASGFEATFNRAPNLSVINLYDSTLSLFSGQPATSRPADVTLVGANVGNVKGSLVWEAATNKLSFIKTGGVLAPDNYTATLFSRADAFHAASGLLDGDGDLNDNELNDNYVATTTIAVSNQRVVSVRDFARGPGQTVNDAPASGNTKLAIRISDAANITRVSLVLKWDAALLSILTNPPQNTLTKLVPGLPPDWSLAVAPTGSNTLALTASGTTPLSGTDAPLILLEALVPQSATLGSAAAIQITSVSVNNGAIPASGDYAVHAVSYLGDADGNGIYTGYDSALISRVAHGFDSGFNARSWIDPAILASTSSAASLADEDATLVAKKSVGLPVPEIPDLPVFAIGSGSLAAEAATPVSASVISIPLLVASPLAVAVPSVVVGPLRPKQNLPTPAVGLASTAQFALASVGQTGLRLADIVGKTSKTLTAVPQPPRVTLSPKNVDVVLTASNASRSLLFAGGTLARELDELQSILDRPSF